MEDKFEQWVLIELYGHQRIIGKATEATIGGCSFIRVDIPEMEGKSPFTRYFGQGAIYSLSPVSEEIAKELLKRYRNVPVQQYEISSKPTMLPVDEDHFTSPEDE